MFKQFLAIATGRSHYATLFLVVFMFVAPASMFTEIVWLDTLGWAMTIILGIFIFITGIVSIQEGRQSFHWPQANAKLKGARLISHSGSKGGMTYAPKVTCSFVVDGQEYEGTEYDFSASYTSKEKAQKKVTEIKCMQTLLVHYKPEDPSINVIHPGVHFVAYMRLFVGVGGVAIPILSLLGYIQY
ncbi:MAG: DUF3592 domain-containing protein [Oleispira sp.]